MMSIFIILEILNANIGNSS